MPGLSLLPAMDLLTFQVLRNLVGYSIRKGQRCQQIKPDLIDLTNKSNRPDQITLFTYLVKADFIDDLFDAI